MLQQSPSTTAHAIEVEDLDTPDPSPSELEARARAWHVSSDPARLWPGLDARALPPAATAIERSVATLLAGGRSSLSLPDGSDPRVLGVAALLSGTGPLLGYWVERGLLDVSEAVARVLARHLSHSRRRMLRMTQGVTPVLSALVTAGMTPAVIKGFDTAYRYFPEPGIRPVSDVDVVITPEQVQRAEAVLAAAGFTGDQVIERPYKRKWHPPGADGGLGSLEFWHADSPWQLDLHDAASFWELTRFGIQLDHPLEQSVPWDALGVPLRVPPPPLMVVVLAAHLSTELSVTRLIRLVELALVIRRERAQGALDWSVVEGLVDRVGAQRFVYPAFALVQQLAPGTVDEGMLARLRQASTRVGRHVVDQLTPASPILEERVSLSRRLMFASGPVEFLRRLALMVAPVPGSVRTNLQVYHSRLRRLLTARVTWPVSRAGPVAREPVS
jgi:hypothetical protein